MLHGVGESAVGWRPIRQALSDDYEVIAFDLPGFGRSPALPGGVAPTAAALADAIEVERVHQAAALLTGRTLAMLLAPIATQVAATGTGRSLFFAMERSRPWQLPAEDAGQLLLDFAQAPGYLETVQAAMVDVPTRLEVETASAARPRRGTRRRPALPLRSTTTRSRAQRPWSRSGPSKGSSVPVPGGLG